MSKQHRKTPPVLRHVAEPGDFQKRSRASVSRFVLVFALVAGAGHAFEYWCMRTNSVRGYRHVVAVGGAWLARSAGFEVQADGTALAAGARMLEVTPECAAIDALSIFVAGVLAFPCDWRRKALGASAGLLLIMVANIGRIGLLGGLAASRPAHFDSVHEKFMHVFPLAVVLPLWLAWIVWIARPRAPRREAPVLT